MITFDPDEPWDPAACTVEDQYPIGEVDPGADVTLTVSCEVPDVIGLDGQSAIDELESAGFTWYLDDCDDAPEACTVADQDFFDAQPGEEIGLTMEVDDDPYSGGGGYETDDLDSADCHESYPDDCLDPYSEDYDCEGNEGNGPDYVAGPITVDHSVADPDPFELDRDLDGTGCD